MASSDWHLFGVATAFAPKPRKEYGNKDGDPQPPTDEDAYYILNVHTQWIFHFNHVPKSKDIDLTKLTKHQVPQVDIWKGNCSNGVSFVDVQ
eukprot:scaffold17327_cov67-Attheya_sp.AAC.10